MRIALAQMNTSVGDLEGNAARILEWAGRAGTGGADLVVTPELATTGYPPLDLLFKRHFVTAQLDLLRGRILSHLPIPALIGFVDRDEAGNLYNAAALVEGGEIRHVQHKRLLPTYDVFDEWRYFKPGATSVPVDFGGLRIGVTICEDLWDECYECKVVPQLAAQGAELIINLSSSPYHMGKGEERVALLRRHATENRVAMLYCNLAGAQDELIFDGDSLAMDAKGTLIARGAQFAEELLLVEVSPVGTAVRLSAVARTSGRAVTVPLSADALTGVPTPDTLTHVPTEAISELAGALTLGIRDYFAKCGFSSAVVGLSGGVDSAVTACLACSVLGGENVIGLAMPSRYNAPESTSDAQALAAALGMEFHVLPIEESVERAMARYMAEFGAYADPVTIENLQSRERGKTIMEVSNDRRALVLSTGNKTEYALGYTTLYGDMCGGLAVLGDVDKPLVYEMARWFNAGATQGGGELLIPERTISRPPSAELREGQVDPFDYPRISPLADMVVEEHLSRAELLARGYSEAEVDTVLRLVRLSEYKRKQAPPILRVTEKAFGIGRRMPIANGFRE